MTSTPITHDDFAATVTAAGLESILECEGAVDATVTFRGERLCSVSLVDGELPGDCPDYWCDDPAAVQALTTDDTEFADIADMIADAVPVSIVE